MNEILQYILLLGLMIASVVLAGKSINKTSASVKNDDNNRFVHKKDLNEFESKINQSLSIMMESIVSIESSLKLEINKNELEYKISKIEDMIEDVNSRVMDHCDENTNSFSEVVQDIDKMAKSVEVKFALANFNNHSKWMILEEKFSTNQNRKPTKRQKQEQSDSMFENLLKDYTEKVKEDIRTH